MLFIIFGEMSCNDKKDGYSVWSKMSRCVYSHESTRAVSLVLKLMMYWHCLGLEPGPGQEPGPVLCTTFHIAPGLGRMGCMVLIRTFHTAPEEGQGRTLVFITKNIFRTWEMGTRPILQVLKMFLVFFPVPVQVQCESFLLKPYNPFFLVPVPVLVPVPDQASVNTPSVLGVPIFVLIGHYTYTTRNSELSKKLT